MSWAWCVFEWSDILSLSSSLHVFQMSALSTESFCICETDVKGHFMILTKREEVKGKRGTDPSSFGPISFHDALLIHTEFVPCPSTSSLQDPRVLSKHRLSYPQRT